MHPLRWTCCLAPLALAVAPMGTRADGAPPREAPRGAPALVESTQAITAHGPRAKVALTFDDLPVHMTLPPGTSRLDVAKGIVGALKAAKAPPTYGFINAKTADTPENVEFLRLWRAAGHPLANHTFAHMDFDTNETAAFQANILANEPTLRELMGSGDWHWFRYPYLREGNTLEKRNAVRSFLKEHGYRVAQVTLDFWDWAFNDPYARCEAKNDAAAVSWLKETYLSQAAASLTEGQQLATQVYGHDIRHVMLLHVGAFEIVMLPRLLDLLERRGFDLVTLEEAQSDPAYAIDPGQAREGGATLLHQMLAAKGLPPPPRSDSPFEKVTGLCR